MQVAFASKCNCECVLHSSLYWLRQSGVMRHALQPINTKDRTAYQAIDLAPKWASGVVSKIRAVQVAGLSGRQIYKVGGYHLPRATGILDLTGHREGALRTRLVIGFSDASEMPPPDFYVDESQAIGTISFPSHLFAPLMQIAHLPNAHFRISSMGDLNALASDATMLQQSD